MDGNTELSVVKDWGFKVVSSAEWYESIAWGNQPKKKSREPKYAKLEVEAEPKNISDLINVWYLLYQGSEFGPFQLDELKYILKSGKLQGEIFVRKNGAGEWLSLQDER